MIQKPEFKIFLDLDNDGVCGANMLTYSEDLSQSEWSGGCHSCYVSADATAAPDGTETADKLCETATYAQHYIIRDFPSLSNNGDIIFSFYGKAGERNQFWLEFCTKASQWTKNVTVDFQTGTIVQQTNLVASITDAGDGYYRVSISFNVGSGSYTPCVAFSPWVGSSYTYMGTSGYGLYLWGFQLEGRSVSVHTYDKTESRALAGANIETAFLQDISDYFISANIAVGRDYPGALEGKSVAGMATIELKNYNGEFNIRYGSSPFYGYLLPGRKIQIAVVYYGVPYRLFSGTLDRIEPKLDRSGNHTATLTALGVLNIFNETTALVEMRESITTSDAIDLILDAMDWPDADRSIAECSTVMERWGGQSGYALELLRGVEATEWGFLWEDADGKLCFDDRNYRYNAARSNTSQATFSDAANAVLKYQKLEPIDSRKQIANTVTAEIIPYVIGDAIVIWTHPETGTSSPCILPSAKLSVRVKCPSDYVGIDEWITPVATTDYTANVAPTGTGTDLTSSMSVVATKYFTEVLLEITNNAVQVAYLTKLCIRGTPVTLGDSITVQSDDEVGATSVAKYGVREFEVASKFLANSEAAKIYCNYIASNFGEPQPLCSISYLANSDQLYLYEALRRRLRDRITLVATGVTKLGVSQDFYVETIKYSMTPGQFNVSYQLSPSESTEGGVWALGSSVLGSDTVLSSRW